MRVLHVEDDDHVAKAIRRVLEKAGCFVERVRSLQEALTRLAAGEIDVVFLDLHLEDSRGIDTIKAVRSKFAFIPIVVVTGSVSADALNVPLSLGVQEFIMKGDNNFVGRLRLAVTRARMERSSVPCAKAVNDAIAAIRGAQRER